MDPFAMAVRTVRRLVAWGGAVRTAAPVARIEAPGGRVRAVVTEAGERIPTDIVVTALDPRVALGELLDPPLGEQRAGTWPPPGNVVQALVHVATDRLPAYPEAGPGDWNGLQSYVDGIDDLSSAWVAAEAGELPEPLPLYAFTPSALDPGLAPPGAHTVYLACPAAPARIAGGWDRRRDEFVERASAVLERRAPGFGGTVMGVAARTPLDMERERWVGAHPMHLDIALDQLGLFRPTPTLNSHRTPIEGLYVSGAGTSPTGGIAGTPGRQAARAVLADRRRR
ncbi:MAG: phytoene desaturase family protein [Acidimicrobiia bacterium]